ncbi:MAG: NAD(P)/FAD-dependent oxidoreductase [Candidatus Riflebacteria bacterium]
MKQQLIIVGAGPAGLMAAIKAAEAGVECLVIESMPKPARKLGISGKGRGNLTNTAGYNEFLKHFNRQGRFLKFAFKQFFNNDLVEFFNQAGLETVEERGGRVFAASGHAPEIVGKLVAAAEKRGVRILTDRPVKKISRTDQGFIVSTQNRDFHCPVLIIATGGKSYPLTGSTGDGFRFAAELGHEITPLYPSLVALKPDVQLPGTVDRLSLRNINAQLLCGEKKTAEEFGEMTFIDGYLAGPVIITLSRLAAPMLASDKPTFISVDLKPALNHEKLDQRLLRDLQQMAKEPLQRFFAGLLPAQMTDFCSQTLKFNLNSPCHQFTAENRRKLRNWLKDLRFRIVEPGPWSQAIVTAGGIDCGQIDSTTMESKIQPNLFFAGEIIDIDADTGGYNLQAAFSTGWLAGRSAAARIGN